LVDFTAISTKNVDWSRATSFERGKARVKGKDIAHIIIVIPTGIPNMKEAVDRAIESVPGGVALLDGVLYHKWFYIPPLYGQSWYVIEGTPLIDPAQKTSSSDTSGRSDCVLVWCDKQGNVQGTSTTTLAGGEPLSADDLARAMQAAAGQTQSRARDGTP